MRVRINKDLEKDLPVGKVSALVANKLPEPFVKEATHQERLINEIIGIANCSREDIVSYCQKSTSSLEQIKNSLLEGGMVFDKEISTFLVDTSFRMRLTSCQDMEKKINNLLTDIPPRTWQDTLSDIPYFTAYYIAYPFIWLTYWLWQGVAQAKEEIWE